MKQYKRDVHDGCNARDARQHERLTRDRPWRFSLGEDSLTRH
ncbi:hypothetical protein [Nostoc sp. C052]|nr:hypothetical protein [Nostoc sp. C052]